MRLRTHVQPCRHTVTTFLLAPRCYAVYGQRQFSSDPRRETKDVAILGGGITGLATAYWLTHRFPAYKVTLYEAGNELGGWIRSKRVEVEGGSVLFESGSRSLRSGDLTTATESLIDELDLENDCIFTSKRSPAATNRYIYYPDRPLQLPGPGQGIFNLLRTILFEPVFRDFAWSALTEHLKPERPESLVDESLGSFISRRLSKSVADNIASAVIHGIYAGDLYKLSAKALVTRMWHDEGAYGSLSHAFAQRRSEKSRLVNEKDEEFKKKVPISMNRGFRKKLDECSIYTFRNGLSQLPERLERRLLDDGQVDFKTNTRITKIEQDPQTKEMKLFASDAASPLQAHTHIISTLSGSVLSSITPSPADPSRSLVPTLAENPSVTVGVVNLFFRTSTILPITGFGYLIPRSVPFHLNPEFALGVVFDSVATPGQDTAPGTKLTVMLGGHWWDGWSEYPDSKELVAMARTVLARHLGVVEEPLATNVAVQKDCIPQYVVGHYGRMRRADESLRETFGGRLRVAGNSYSGVGVNDCIRAAWEIVDGFREETPESEARTGLERFRQQGEVWKAVPK